MNVAYIAGGIERRWLATLAFYPLKTGGSVNAKPMSQPRRNWLQREANRAIALAGKSPEAVRHWLVSEGASESIADEIVATAIERKPAVLRYFKDMDRATRRDLRLVTPFTVALAAGVVALILLAILH